MAEYWEVIYKAIGDFGDLIKDAAAAKAALKALSDQQVLSAGQEATAIAKATEARKQDILVMKQQDEAFRSVATSAEKATVWTDFGGRDSMAQHLSDLGQETNWLNLINRQKWLGFTSPQAAYGWRQLEMQQLWLMNRAKFGATSSGTGYTTPDQYLSYLQKEYAADSALNTVQKERVQLYQNLANAYLAYANSQRGAHESIGTLGEGVLGASTAVQGYQAAVAGVPSEVTTTMNVDDSAAIAKLAAWNAIVRGTPKVITTDEVIKAAYGSGGVDIGGILGGGGASGGGGGGGPPLGSSGAGDNPLIAALLALTDAVKAQTAATNANTAATLHGGTSSVVAAVPSASGGGQQPSDIAQGIAAASAAAAAAAVPMNTLASAEKNVAAGAGDAVGKLMAQAAAANTASDAAKYAYAASILAAAGNDKATAGAVATTAATKTAAAGVGAAAAAVGFFSKQFVLFGGLFGTIPFVTATHGWEIAIHAVIEAMVLLTATVLALGAAYLGIYPTAEDLYNHLKAVDTVNASLASGIPPLTTNLLKFQQSMAPQVLELYGGGIDAISHSTGNLKSVIGQTVTGFDGFIAKVDLFLQSQQGFGKVLQSGVGFLSQLEVIVGNLGVAFYKLLQSDPGTVHFLLDLIELASRAVGILASLPTPILTSVIAFHSFVTWGSLMTDWMRALVAPTAAAVQSIAKLAAGAGLLGSKAQETLIPLQDLRKNVDAAEGSTSGMQKTLSGLAGAGPWAWAAAGVVALGALVFWMTRADTATTGFITNMNMGLSQLSASQAITGINVDIASLNKQIDGVVPRIQSMNDAANKASTSLGKSIEATITGIPESLASWSSFGKEVGNVGDDFLNLGHLVGKTFSLIHGVMSQGSDTSAYQGAIVNLTREQTRLFTTIGDVMRGQAGLTKTVNDATGVSSNAAKVTYNYSQALALLDLAGVKVGDSQAVQLQKVKNLILGYENMSVQAGILQSGVDAVTLASEQQASGISSLTGAWTSFLGLVTGGESSFVALEQAMGTLQTDAKATGASMTGLNANSLTLRGGFTAAVTSAGAMFNSLTNLSSAAALGAKGTAMMTQAGKDMVAQLAAQTGGSKAAVTQLYAFAQIAGYTGPDSLKALTQWAGNAAGAEQNLDSITTTLTKDAGNLAKDMQNLAFAVGQTMNQAMAAAIIQTGGGQKAFDNFANAAHDAKGNLDSMKGSAQALATELLTALAGNTKEAHDEFDAFARQMGISQKQADQLWASVVRLAEAEAKIPPVVKTVFQIDEQIQKISGSLISSSQGSGGSGNIAGGLATGGRIPGYNPGVDSVDAKLSPGEFVLTPEAASAIGYGNLDAVNSHYAGGRQSYAWGGKAWMAGGGATVKPSAPLGQKASAWRYPAPTGLGAYDITDQGFRLYWTPVHGPTGQSPSSYTVETFQMNGVKVDQFTVGNVDTAEYGYNGTGLHPGWQYQTYVWANGGPLAPPHAIMDTTLLQQYATGPGSYRVGQSSGTIVSPTSPAGSTSASSSTGTSGTTGYTGPVITPGISSGPTGATTIYGPVNLQPYAMIGGPRNPVVGAHPDYGFAAGGTVSPGKFAASLGYMADGGVVAGMFGGLPSVPHMAWGGMAPGLSRTLRMANGGSPSRVMSDAGAAGAGVNVNMTVNNPLPERASDSIARSSNRLAFLAGRGVA